MTKKEKSLDLPEARMEEKARDTFASLKKTCRKLDISFGDGMWGFSL
ncbi:MAG: hypothetical protein AAF600_00860 [Bacteroidota bacterium]